MAFGPFFSQPTKPETMGHGDLGNVDQCLLLTQVEQQPRLRFPFGGVHLGEKAGYLKGGLGTEIQVVSHVDRDLVRHR